MFSILARLVFLGAAVAADVAPSSSCEGGTCDAAEESALLQVPAKESARLQPEAQDPRVECLFYNRNFTKTYGTYCDNRTDVVANKFQCCSAHPDLMLTFPCPGTANVPGKKSPCVISEGPPVLPSGSSSQPAYEPRQPPDQQLFRLPAVWKKPVDGFYGKMNLLGHNSLTEFMQASFGTAIKSVIPIPGESATAIEKVANGSLQWQHGIAGLWGDVGPQFQPGFGGIRTANAATITVEPKRKFFLYTMWSPDGKEGGHYGCYPIGIWWSGAQSYAGTLLEASVHAATTYPYTHVTECEMNDSFDVILGQGWNIDKFGCYEREDCLLNATGHPEGRNDIARYMINGSAPPPPDKFPQFIVNAKTHAKKCVYAPLDAKNVSGSIANAAESDKVEINLPKGDHPVNSDKFPSPCNDKIPMKVGGLLDDYLPSDLTNLHR